MNLLANFLQDFRFALRMLRKSPGFTAVAVLTLTLGIGANTAIFSAVNAALLRPLPYLQPQSLVEVSNTYMPAWPKLGLSPGDFQDFQSHNRSFSEMAAYVDVPTGFNLTGQGDPGRVQAAFATASLFPLLGVHPVVGSAFNSNEDKPGSDLVVMLSHQYWASRFGSDPGFVGRTVLLDGQAHRIVGVLPANFTLVSGADIWMPVGQYGDDLTGRVHHPYNALARLKPGVTVTQAQSDLRSLNEQIAKSFADTHKNWGLIVESMKNPAAVQMRAALLALSAAVGLILLIACVNIMNLLLAKNASRKRELAVRVALGAGPGRLAAQLLTESLLLAFCGGLAGFVLSIVLLRLAASIVPAMLAPIAHRGADLRVFAFTAAVCILTGVLCGLAPALQTFKPDIQRALNESGRSGSPSISQKFSSLLVVSEFGMALVLLVGAGLLLRSLDRLLDVQPGFERQHLLTLEVDQPQLSLAQFNALSQDQQQKLSDQQSQQFEDIAARIEALPGVRAAGGVTVLPLATKLVSASRFLIEGRPVPDAGARPVAETRGVSLGYFSAMEIPLLRGRLFTARDWDLQNVVINEAMAHQYWPNEDPLGKRINICSLAPQPCWFSIIGVVGDVRQFGLDAQPTDDLYLAGGWTSEIVIRANTDPTTLAAAVTTEIHRADPNLPITRVLTMDNLLSETVSPRKFSTVLLIVFAVVALLLAAVGIYGVMSRLVAARTNELGIRMALGAAPLGILRLILARGAKLAAAGVVLGLVGAFAVTRFLSSLLFGVTAFDPLTFVAVSALLVLVALLACYIPARRATRVDPIVALRYE